MINLVDECHMCIGKNMTLDDTSKYLKMSTRTLQRKLAGHKTSWSELTESHDHHDRLSHITPPSNSSDGNDGSMETPRALTEAAIEAAIDRALIQDPIRALPIAINWMAKKGQITLDTDSLIEGEMRDYYNEVLGMYK